jgi:hypothetical protein
MRSRTLEMHQAVDAAEIDECAEVDDRGHDNFADGALCNKVEELAAHLGLVRSSRAAAQHRCCGSVELDDPGLDLRKVEYGCDRGRDAFSDAQEAAG